jgi:hypothetical protein
MSGTDEPRPSGTRALLLGPPAFVVLMWAGYVACVKAFFPPIEPGDEDGDLVLMFPFLFLALITLAVVAVWLIALAVVLVGHLRTCVQEPS